MREEPHAGGLVGGRDAEVTDPSRHDDACRVGESGQAISATVTLRETARTSPSPGPAMPRVVAAWHAPMLRVEGTTQPPDLEYQPAEVRRWATAEAASRGTQGQFPGSRPLCTSDFVAQPSQEALLLGHCTMSSGAEASEGGLPRSMDMAAAEECEEDGWRQRDSLLADEVGGQGSLLSGSSFD